VPRQGEGVGALPAPGGGKPGRERRRKRPGRAKKSTAVEAEIIELDDGNIYRKTLYLMVKTVVSCRFSLKPIH